MTEGKDEEEGMRMKKVIGVAAVIVVIMAVVLIAFSSTASASFINRTFTPTGGTLNYTGGFASGGDPEDEDATNISLVYNWESGKKAGGEKIGFFNLTSGTNASVCVEGPYTKTGKQYSGYDVETELVPAGGVWDAEGRKTSGYFMVWDKNTTGTDKKGGWLQVVKQKFTVELSGEREKVQEGKNFSLILKSNNKEGKVMKLTIEDNERYSIMNDIEQDIYEVLVNYTKIEGKPKFTSDPVMADSTPVYGITHEEGKLVFNTSQLDMKKGKYWIILEDYATEETVETDITVEKWYLEIVEWKDEVIKGWEDIVITLHSSFYEQEVNVTVEDIPKWKEGRTLTLDEEGKKRVRISTKNETVHYGRYKVMVKVVEFPACAETRYVLIKKGKTTLEVPENATVGDIVRIEGKSNYGYLAVFVIDDVYKSDAAIVDGKFGWYWDTARELDGYYGIDVFILDKSPSFDIGDEFPEDWQREKVVDASSSIILNSPTFSMTAPKCIAKGDPVVISGTAAGADHVYVIVFNYRGDVMFPYTKNMSPAPANATFVEEGKWTETLSALDFGEYTVIALDKGEDGRTRAINETTGKWEIGGESKTLEQRVAILMDAITFVGSDDLYAKACFSVSAPEIILKVPETVEICTAISVNAKTNMREGEKAFISLSQNSSIIKKNSPEVKNGSVTASIDTSGLQPGKYNVAVDVSGRASDEKEVVLVEKSKEPIPKNESLTEPASEAVKEANETVGEGEFLNETGDGWEEVQKKIPVNMCDLLIAVVVAIFISFVVRRRG